MLPYVQEHAAETAGDNPDDVRVVMETKNTRNPLLIVAWVLIGVGGLLMFLVVPMVVATGFAVAALVTAVRRDLRKRSAVIAVVISATLSVLGTVVLAMLISLYEAPVPLNIPANYSYDPSGNIAFVISPSGAVPCDDTGKCVMEFDYIITSSMCTSGGNVYQEAAGNYAPSGIVTETEFPATPIGGQGTVELVFYSVPDDYLLVSGPPYITCY